MKTKLIFLALVTTTGVALAAPETFDFKDPKGINNAGFKLDAPLESINGSASGIYGTVTFDPANRGATQGKITVATSSLIVPNPLQRQHMLGKEWLDATKFPTIIFESKEFKNVQTAGDTTTADVTGTFTLKGVSKELTMPVKLTYLKDKLADRVPSQKGDLLVIRSRFTIKRSDFNINPGQFEDKVSDAIEITLSIAGASPK
ncbi:MAG TPA: YceI family protein [Verrucomicrobiae bacterium]|nr:YceI family protein [Verrucomicrobiae bacterium]